MTKKQINNFAFIDSNNLHLGIRKLGWQLDYKRFRVYLKEKYNVTKAYLFIGYIPQNQDLYNSLQEAGYILIFKPTLMSKDGQVKGNCDAELVLQAMIDIDDYDRAVIVTGDGDFQCLVKYLYKKRKLKTVLCPNKSHSSVLLRKAAKEKVHFMDYLSKKLEYKKNTASRQN